ncbi:hypothetical protein E0Z10_g7344 [Xylaria hypoxylon]|uniref:Uncharacterized protein n=1 Tax=Xylaria hypoxylon TaxID=37992 RepID=A0A4Z0YE52_9PEZI|nr:hypothetical protein E0Z10_g7344 [Xylaria hypoxylon]
MQRAWQKRGRREYPLYRYYQGVIRGLSLGDRFQSLADVAIANVTMQGWWEYMNDVSCRRSRQAIEQNEAIQRFGTLIKHETGSSFLQSQV